MMAAIFALGIFAGDAHAGSITVTVNDNSANLNLVAADGGVAYGESDTASFSVSTTSSGGYTAIIAGGNSDGKLTGTDSANYFSSIASAISFPSDFNNGTWGFKPSTYNSVSNTSYQPVATSSSAAIIDVTNSATTGNYTLSVAAKTDTNTSPDTYSYDFIVAATTNSIDYDVAFVDPGADMPARMVSSTTDSTITLPSNIPTRSGYAFAGWCTESVAPGSSCTGSTYAAGATYTLDSGSNNVVTMYALWTAVTDTMQDFSCGSLSVGQTKYLVDSRDSTVYQVAKLTDGSGTSKCWMLDNLALGSTSQSYHLTSNDTHLNSGATYDLPKSAVWSSSSTASYINADYKTTVSSDVKDQVGSWKVGVYYNYCAASAGTICTASATADAGYDICPRGWKLPSGGSNGDFQKLYDNTSYNTYDKYRDALHLPMSGFFRNSPINKGKTGDWWSATASVGASRYYLLVASTSASVNAKMGDGTRSDGQAIRCISQ